MKPQIIKVNIQSSDNKKGRSIRIRIETKHSQPYLVGGLYKKGRSIRIRIETSHHDKTREEISVIKKEDPLE